MTSDRPYRRALRWDAAHDEILAQSGKQFDPEVVDAFRERESALRDAARARRRLTSGHVWGQAPSRNARALHAASGERAIRRLSDRTPG